jgi:hypothetical protein
VSALRAALAIGLAGFFLLLVGPPMFENPPWPYTGIKPASNTGIFSSIVVNVDPGSPAFRAGVRTGDLVGCLSARDAAIAFPSYSPHFAYTGGPVRFCVRHNGVWSIMQLLPKHMPPPGLIYLSPAVAALRLASFIVFLFAGCALVLARPGLMTWLFFGYCLASMPLAAAIGMLVWLPPALYLLLVHFPQAIAWSGAGFLALFALVIPDNYPPPGWRRIAFPIIGTATVLNAAFAAAAVSGPIAWATNSSWIWSQTISGIDRGFTALVVLIVVARLATMQRQDRARFGWAAFAIILGVVINNIRNINRDPVVSDAAGVLTVVMPLLLMYAILRRHVIDVRFVISKTVVYGIITTLVIGIIGVVDWATSAYLTQERVALAIDAAVTIALGYALHHTYGRIEYIVDFLLFRKKHEAEAYLKRAARALLRADSEKTINDVLVGDPFEVLDLTMAAVFRRSGSAYALECAAGWSAPDALRFERGHDIVRFLESERARLALRDLRKHVTAEFVEAGTVPAVAIPIFRGDDLFAFTLYGLHRDGTQLDPDEIDVLERLCESAAQAYTSVELAQYQKFATPFQVRVT